MQNWEGAALNVRGANLIIGLALLVAFQTVLHAQNYGTRLGIQRGGEVSFEPRGPGVLFGSLDPAIQKWYVPQELYYEFRWRQWEYSNYARDQYQRYINTNLEGDYFYDFFGNYINRGWLVYDWRQDQPQELGSGIFKGRQFEQFFSSVTVSGDSKGQYSYAITVGNAIRTTLTPMTFSKPNFNGVQIDFASDKYAATVLASRINDPAVGVTINPRRQSNSTSLFGGRALAQVGDFITLGGTVVNAHNANTALDMFEGNLLAGNLTSGQTSTPVTAIAIVLSDDSPEDEAGGAALFSHDIRIKSRDFETGLETVLTLDEVVREGAEWPTVFGGFPRTGFLAADGTERIILNYDFTDPAYVGPDLTSIVEVEFDYVLANDFKVEMWSNLQTGTRPVPPPPLTNQVIEEAEPVLIEISRASGNIRDISNAQRVLFNYGLPSANMVAGFTIEGKKVWGFDFYGEWNNNLRYFQYPNAALFNANEGHEVSAESGQAAIFNLSKEAYPFFTYGEAYSVDADYSTSAFVSLPQGDVFYDDPIRSVYEFVADNDDQDRQPDWARVGSQANDREVFPGWDENLDFISDFNQNDNRSVPNSIPDYDEPFLRYHVDRPELLFGIDLNNNGWIDRFEDDDLADYPYKPDRRGYNVFFGVHLLPEARLLVGRLDERMLSDDRDNQTSYAMFTLDKDYPGFGRVRVFDMLKRVVDTIPDDRRAPLPFLDAPTPPLVSDMLFFPDTWINTAWLGVDYTAIANFEIVNKLKYERYNQAQDEARDIDGRVLAGSPSLLGLINKFEYKLHLGHFILQPRFKSEYFRQDNFVLAEEDLKQWTGIVSLLAQVPLLNSSVIDFGVELAQFNELVQQEEDMVEQGIAEETGDLRSAVFAVQLTNNSNYLGYKLTTQLGLRIGRTFTELVQEVEPRVFGKLTKGRTETTSFITIYAGL